MMLFLRIALLVIVVTLLVRWILWRFFDRTVPYVILLLMTLSAVVVVAAMLYGLSQLVH